MPSKAGGGNVKDVVALQKKLEKQRQDAAKEKEDVDNSFRAFRSTLLMAWLTTNGIWLYFVTDFVSSSCYLKGLSWVVAFFNIIRFTGAFVYILLRICRRFGINCSRSGGGYRNTYEHNLPADWQAHYNDQNANGGVPRPIRTNDSSRDTLTPQTAYRHV
jgi:chitin synthase